MEYTSRLYVILHPNTALVASQLPPDKFAKHYTSGSSQHAQGKVVFAELDIAFRNPYFRIDDVLQNLTPHEDGRPKSTKFISTYRVLEHIDFYALKDLYLATQEGHCIRLQQGQYQSPLEEGFVRIYAEITPMRMLVLSDYNFVEFGSHITDPSLYKSAPRQFYTQLDVNLLEFIEEFESNPFVQSPVSSMHPSTLRDAFYEIKRYPNKHTKGLCVDSSLDQISYKLIRKGFMFSSQEQSVFYPIPSLEEMEKINFKFWKAL
jgi:hypothetical protein